MPIYLAFLSVVAIWSTTPLAIQWSTLGSSFNFGVVSRMLLGLVICFAVLAVKKQTLSKTNAAISNYIYAGLGVFVTMSLVYYASQTIPSGIEEIPIFHWKMEGLDILKGRFEVIWEMNAHYHPEDAIKIE